MDIINVKINRHHEKDIRFEKEQIEILGIKNIISEMKSLVDGIIIRLNTAEENASEFKDGIEILKLTL